jgi:DNA-binding CsgD family transcriptional regulator
MELTRESFPAEIFQIFAKRELQNIIEILHYTTQARTPEDVTAVLHRVKKLMPFEQIIGGMVQMDEHGSVERNAKVVNVSYPNDWLYVYAKNGYVEVDPVFVSLMQRPGRQVWNHTYGAATQPKQLAFIEEARSFGLMNGITVSEHLPEQKRFSFFSFAGRVKGETERFAPVVEYLMRHLHQVLFEQGFEGEPSASPLSARELAVLKWVKLGKTNGEIAVILGISKRTVRFHIERIFVKLDVLHRAQAVACAMERGLLPLRD